MFKVIVGITSADLQVQLNAEPLPFKISGFSGLNVILEKPTPVTVDASSTSVKSNPDGTIETTAKTFNTDGTEKTSVTTTQDAKGNPAVNK